MHRTRSLLVTASALALACSTADAVRTDTPPPPAAAQAPAAPARMAYPETPKKPVTETLHGVTLTDAYQWLEDEKAPEVQAWMQAQDGFTRQRLAALPARDALARRFRELLYMEAVGIPVKRGQRFFYARTHKDREKAIIYWKDGEQGAEKVLLDPNAWSKDGTVSLGVWVPSWDGKKVVFAKKPNAADEATLHVLDVESGTVSETDVIPGAKYAGPSWTPDNKAFYYEWLPVDPTIPVSERPGYTELRLHALGTPPAKDPVVRERTGDPKTFLSGSLSRDGKYLFAYVLRGWSENDVYVKRLGKDRDWVLLVKGQGAKYTVEAWKDRFYVTTDEGAPNQRVFRVRPDRLARKDWQEVVPEDKSASLQSASVVGNHLALSYLKNAASELRVATLDGKPVRTVQLPGLGSASGFVGLEDQDDAYFRFSSFVSPPQVYRTSVKGGQVDLWAKVELPLDPSAFTVEQAWYTSKDGTKVPMFLVHKKGLVRDGATPTLLYGYGGFNVSLTPDFKTTLYPWLEAGGVYAVANLRGGGEFGKAWHEAGRLGNKQNVFDDFIAAGEFLVKERYTRPDRLAIYGGSNGGLLVGAAMVQRPDLFGAVVCAVPLLDMVRYHRFGSGRTWIPEYGTAERAEDFAFIHKYSPYQQVRPDVAYPALLMMAADHDDRVDPNHARKFVAAVQASEATRAPVLLRIERNAGHGGADQVAKTIEASADLYAFLFAQFGMQAGAESGTARGPAAGR